MNNALKVESAALCLDCSSVLPADADADICAVCIAAEWSAYLDRQSCRNTLPERMGECVCGHHQGVC
jgi:hypothetical protein